MYSALHLVCMIVSRKDAKALRKTKKINLLVVQRHFAFISGVADTPCSQSHSWEQKYCGSDGDEKLERQFTTTLQSCW